MQARILYLPGPPRRGTGGTLSMNISPKIRATRLAKIADYPVSQIQDLLPWNVAPSLQAHASEAA